MALRIDRAGNYEAQEDSDYLAISSHLNSRIYCWNIYWLIFLSAGSRWRESNVCSCFGIRNWFALLKHCHYLVCGARASKDMVRAGEESATVEAVFDRIPENVRLLLSDFGCNTEDGELVLSFSIFPDGRSNIRANGKSVTKGLLRQIGKSLVSVCGQDDARVRYTGEVCTSMLDSFAGDSEVFDKYSSSYTELQTYKNKLEQIKQNDASLRREKDMLEYQIRDIDSKKLRPGEEEVLEEEKKKLGSIEKINKQVAFSYKIFAFNFS